MATLPTELTLTSAQTTNAQMKAALAAQRQLIADLLGTDSANKAAARAALGALSRVDIVASLAVNGYVSIPIADNKVWIVQQCAVSVTAVNGAVQAFAFPIRFPTTCLAVIGGGDAQGSAAMVKVGRASGDLTGQFLVKNFGTAAEPTNIIAIGC